MSQVAAGGAMGHEHGPARHPALRRENITLGQSGKGAAGMLLGLGALGIIAVLIGAFSGGEGSLKHALAAYHMGVVLCLEITLGSLFLVMVFHLIRAGWSSSIRRVFELVASQVPVVLVMLLVVLVIELALGGRLFHWLDAAHVGDDPVYAKKAIFLNPTAFVARFVLYGAVWTFLSRRMIGLSRAQDASGDRWLSNKARFTSSWGMLIFALTTAFAGFDYLMSMDYHFFSTMWGVYFFAGSAFSGTAFITLVLARLRAAGKLEGVVTEEHFHDLGKLLFAFTVFWAYISFSQYFLIWYSNIPEETAFYLGRKEFGWRNVGMLLIIGHFALPFYVLLWRGVRRSPKALTVVAVWMLLVQALDIFWVVRPMVFMEGADRLQLGRIWVDVGGFLGAFGIWATILVRRMSTGPLVPLQDPRLHEGLAHKNYV